MTACGERKQWKREFEKAGASSTSAQIKYLKQMLKDLGMSSGRMSLEAAKKIGERRSLEKEAAELGIAVAGGEAESGGGRQRRAAALKKPDPPQPMKIDSEDDSEEEVPQEDDNDESSSAFEDESDDEVGKKVSRRAILLDFNVYTLPQETGKKGSKSKKTAENKDGGSSGESSSEAGDSD